jgi:hypothetical protein
MVPPLLLSGQFERSSACGHRRAKAQSNEPVQQRANTFYQAEALGVAEQTEGAREWNAQQLR